MDKIRAKFLVVKVEDNEHGQQVATANAIFGQSGENADFAKATPAGNFSLTIDNPDAKGLFKEGMEVFATFSGKPGGDGDKPEDDDKKNKGVIARKVVNGPTASLEGKVLVHDGITSAPPANAMTADDAAKNGAPDPGSPAHPAALKAFEQRQKPVDPNAPREVTDPKKAALVGGVIPDAAPGGAPSPQAVPASASPASDNPDSEAAPAPADPPKPPASGGTNTAADDAPQGEK